MRMFYFRRSRLATLILVLGVLAALFGEQRQAHAQGNVIYVVSGGSGTRNGTSWANARDLQVALTLSVPGDQLWVKAGVYTPTTSTDRTASFSLVSYRAVYGGFAGTETLLSERNVASNLTILSGEIGAAGSADNSFHVVSGSFTNANAVLDGFIITGGNADGGALWQSHGGGLFMSSGSPTLSNLIISGNSAAIEGGGMYSYGESTGKLTNVTISGNSATNGGGLYIIYGSQWLTNVTISGNSATNGGGLYTDSDSSPTLRHLVISGNSATNGGGLYNRFSEPWLTNVTISGNSATNGGGMYGYYARAALRNTIVWSNPGGTIVDEGFVTDVRYSLIDGGYDGSGNIQDDPRFVVAVPTAPSTGGDLRLQAGSPAINAGINGAIDSDLTSDRDGLTRIVDGVVDMGPYERQMLQQAITFAPIVTKTYGDPPFTVSASTPSGLPVTFSAAGVCAISGTTVTLTSGGTCTITATLAGNATHDPAQASQTLSVATAATTSTLQSSRNPSNAGQSVTFTAKVTSPAGTPGGTVTFKDGETELSTQSLGAGRATFTTTALSAGLHSITVTYAGDTSFAPSTSAAVGQRVKAIPSTTLTSSLNPSRYGERVTFTASVVGSEGQATGTVTFLDGATVLASRTLNGGVATLATSMLSVGSHRITVRYVGNAVYMSAVSPVLSQAVYRALATTTLASSLNPSTVGQAVTLSTRVVAASGGIPTGTVTFKDGASVLATLPLDAFGRVSFRTTALPLGTRSITAVYNGSSTHAPDASTVLRQVVKAVPTVTLASSLNPSRYGERISFTASVVGSVGDATGPVTFFDGATMLGTRTLISGKATLPTSTLSVGSHRITARYAGNAVYAPASSTTLTQPVYRALTTTTLASSLNPSTVGQAVTLSTRVVAASGGIPTGTVTFKDGATVLATLPLDAFGRVSFRTTALPLGTRSITAVYNGSSTHAPDASTVLRQVVK